MDIKIDVNTRDIVIENDDMVLIDGVEAIGQDVSIRLQTFLGEWFLDTRIGMPYFQKIIGQKPRLAAIESIFREAIQETPGIQTIHDLQLDYEGTTRTLSVEFDADTVSGPLTYNEEFII